MATTVVKTIGTGGDYATPALWEAAAPANLVTADQVWEGRILPGNNFSADDIVVELSGSTSDATRYKHLTAAPGASFQDHASASTNPLFVDSTKGATLTSTGAYGTGGAVVLNESFARVSRLQLAGVNGSGTRNVAAVISETATLDACLLESYCGSYNAGTVKMFGGTLRNCLVLQRASGADAIVACINGASAYIDNCTLAVPNGTTAAGAAVRRNYTPVQIRNSAVFGVGVVSSGSGGGLGGSANNYTSAPAITGFSNLAYASAGFENAASDYRITTGSALRNAGGAIAGLNTDVMGTARPQGGAYDVGAYELASAGGGGDTTPPTLSDSITIGTVTSSSIQMSWPAGADDTAVTAYEVSSNGGTSYADVGNVLTYTVTGLAASTSYNLRVRAKDAAGNVSAPLSATQSTSAATVYGFDFDTATGLVFGDLAGALTALARQTAVGIVARAYSTSTGALVATSGTLTTDSAGRLPRWTHASLVSATQYAILFTRVSDGEVCATRMTAT